MVSGAGRKAAEQRRKSSRSSLSKDTYKLLVEQIKKNGKSIQNVPINMIDLGQNIREQYDSDKLQVLAESLTHDGLIQYPTLCLTRPDSKHLAFVCRNGHRRILAAKSLGWQTIEAVIVPFKSVQDEIYHSINANLKEDVFYLDLSFAYQDAADMGESDQEIGKRVGVNPRTVGWYRRLTKMPLVCQALCRKYPDIFTATWAIKLARQGELAKAKDLETKMRALISAKKNGGTQRSHSAVKQRGNLQKQRVACAKVKRMIGDRKHSTHKRFSMELLSELVTAGFISPRAWGRIEKEFFDSQQKRSVSRARRTAS